jgi:hypothetical protein
MKLPLSRNTNIVVQDLGKELLVYDLLTHKVYNLNETSKIVFNACDGKTSFDELKRKYKFTDELIYFALDELRREKLIETEYQSLFKGTSRREIIKKVSLMSMAALPIISSLTAPATVLALSCPGATSGQPSGSQICAPDSSANTCSTVAITSCQSCAATTNVRPICVTPNNPSGVSCTCT